MKSKLIAFLLGASLLTGSTAVLAERGRGGGHDRPRAEQGHDYRGHDRHWDGGRDRVYDRHYGHEQRHRHHWGHRRGHHWGHRGHFRHHALPPAPYPRHQAHGRHLPPPHHGLSIILHGHF